MTDTKDTTKPTTSPAEETKTKAEPKTAQPNEPPAEKTATAEKPAEATPKVEEVGKAPVDNPAESPSQEPAEDPTADTKSETKAGSESSIESKSATKPFSTVEINKLAKQLDQQFAHDDLDATIDVKIPKTAIFMLLLGLVLIIGLGIVYLRI